MGNTCCCKKNDEDYNKPILRNLMYCPYCDTTYTHNEYYSHFYDCKRGNIKSNDIHGEL